MAIENKNIELFQDGEIGILKLNNPPQNYLTNPEIIDLKTLKEFTENNIKGLAITGAGRHFSAGASIDNIFDQIKNKERFITNLTKGNNLLNYIENLNIPTIAAISGVCFGGGLELALSCHIRVCEKNSLFAFPEATQNLIPGMGGHKKLEKLIGNAKALELVMSGEMINSAKASELKMIDYLTGKKESFEFSVNYLKNITKDRSLKVINMIIKSINNSNNLSIDDAVVKDAEMFYELARDEANRRNFK